MGNPAWLPEDEVTCTQLEILRLVNVLYGQRERLSFSASRFRQSIIEFCETRWCNSKPLKPAGDEIPRNSSIEADWISWRDEQLRYRIGYCIWVWFRNRSCEPHLQISI